MSIDSSGSVLPRMPADQRGAGAQPTVGDAALVDGWQREEDRELIERGILLEERERHADERDALLDERECSLRERESRADLREDDRDGPAVGP